MEEGAMPDLIDKPTPKKGITDIDLNTTLAHLVKHNELYVWKLLHLYEEEYKDDATGLIDRVTQEVNSIRVRGKQMFRYHRDYIIMMLHSDDNPYHQIDPYDNKKGLKQTPWIKKKRSKPQEGDDFLFIDP